MNVPPRLLLLTLAKNLSPQREGPLLRALRGSILNGPQGTQGGDLGLGQALDARDIEPLIGSVTAQRAHKLATLKAPEPDRSVLPAAGEHSAVGTHFERPHRSLMGLLHQHA